MKKLKKSKKRKRKAKGINLDLDNIIDVLDLVKIKLMDIKGFQIIMTVKGHMLKD